MKVIIVGGVAGGASAAARLRRLDETMDITMYEKSGFVSYANCGLPYYIGDVIKEERELTLQTPQSFKRRFNVDVKVNHEVIAIDPVHQVVKVHNLEDGSLIEDHYDRLILSPGAKPFNPYGQKEGVYTLRNVEDTLRLKAVVEKKQPKSAVVIGGGFIGVEMAENLKEIGVDVHLVQKADQLMLPFDKDMAAYLHREVVAHGIHLYLDQAVEEIDDDLQVTLSNGQRFRTDLVVVAIGVMPDTHLVKDLNMKLGIKDSIVVNDRMETSIDHIYAVGDAVIVENQDRLISLAGPANKQGRIAANQICGIDDRYQGSYGSSVIKVFNLTAASTGWNEALLHHAKIDYDYVILSPNHHAGYYPNAKPIMMKVLFEKNTYRLLGAQAIGEEGVAKVMDVLATAMQAKMSALDLADLDLVYAPPYSSAKHPVNMAGFMIENIKQGTLKQYYLKNLAELQARKDVTLLDTRTKREYEAGHVDGYINIPVDELRGRMDELDASRPVYVMCQSGVRSYIASRMLANAGFEAYNFTGGYQYYHATMVSQYDCGLTKN